MPTSTLPTLQGSQWASRTPSKRPFDPFGVFGLFHRTTDLWAFVDHLNKDETSFQHFELSQRTKPEANGPRKAGLTVTMKC